MSELTPPPLRVFLVEDSPLLRGLLSDILAELGGIAVIGSAADEAAALQALEARDADLAIVDLQLASGSGIGVLRALNAEPERFGRPRTVVFSAYGHAPLRELCRRLGVDGYFDKAQQMNELIAYVEAARAALAGGH
ncbi:response regulator [Azoarcus sp. DD4]|uniref:response regulator n=1 Tax=Azoarcus sp. DD4 TaxID=2027405 RepID=UPI00112D25B7|nr:response regulator [Azoarcus sp. DD4]QDF95725.1 response regulator [Azoarcus sp. DD4]